MLCYGSDPSHTHHSFIEPKDGEEKKDENGESRFRSDSQVLDANRSISLVLKSQTTSTGFPTRANIDRERHGYEYI